MYGCVGGGEVDCGGGGVGGEGGGRARERERNVEGELGAVWGVRAPRPRGLHTVSISANLSTNLSTKRGKKSGLTNTPTPHSPSAGRITHASTCSSTSGAHILACTTTLTWSSHPFVSEGWCAISRVPVRRWLGAPAELHELPAAHGQFFLVFFVLSYPEVECRPLSGPRDEYLSGTAGRWSGRETNVHSAE